MRRLLPFGLLLPVLLLAACAQQPASPGSTNDQGGPRTNYTPDEVVLRIEYLGGFVPVQTLPMRLPIITIYGDGRVITEGPQIMIYPGPALPNVVERHIGVEGLNRLVTMAVEAGVGSGTDYGTPAVADVPETKFTVSTTDGVLTSQVMALEFDHGLTADQVAARQKLRDLQSALTDLPGTLGEDVVGEEQPYQPEALAAVVWPYVEPEELAQPELTWPGPALPGESMGGYGDLSCLTVTGAELTAVLEAAAQANQLTPWASEGDQRWFVGFRPLLPDESSCTDLRD